ncbi:MAG: hypothetical protein LBN98_07220 [Prevotellaceae bacterium]|jgi:hypothetical protein|nr:hypothetical protein [Prevotellaceae bacterium]
MNDEVGAGFARPVARRAIISIEKQDAPILPIARRAFMPALFVHPLRGSGTGRTPFFY